MNLGENIYSFRTQKNMSQGDLADALDVSRQSVSKWENNNAVPDLDKLIKMSELFGITLDELVGKKPPASTADPASSDKSIPNTQTTTRKITGIILVSSGAIFLLMALSAASPSAANSQFLIGCFLMLCGAIYLNAKHRPGRYCLWVLYLSLWLPMGVFAPSFIRITFAKLIQVAHMGFGGCLLLYSWKKDRQAPACMKKPIAIVFYSVLSATVMISFLFLLFPGLLPTPGLLKG